MGRLLRILSRAEKTLSRLLADIPRYYSTADTRIPCADRDKFAVVAELAEKFSREYGVISVDGARVLFADGWGLARASNARPALVARGEARTPAGLEKICGIMLWNSGMFMLGGSLFSASQFYRQVLS
ncbi:MAG TPA: hypothetical protein DCK87_06225 [Desulfotomaculum sp.]|nr:hypothetical protein [Desulfotomaculum sp.]